MTLNDRIQNLQATVQAASNPIELSKAKAELTCLQAEVKKLQTPSITTMLAESKSQLGGYGLPSSVEIKADPKAPALADTYYFIRQGYYLVFNKADGVYVLSDRDRSRVLEPLRDGNGISYPGKAVYGLFQLIRKGSKQWVRSKEGHRNLQIDTLERKDLQTLLDAKLPWDLLQKAYEWNRDFTKPISFSFNFTNPQLVY